MLRTCVKLRDLDMRVHISHFLSKHSYECLEIWMMYGPEDWGDSTIFLSCASGMLDLFGVLSQLPSLEALNVRHVLPRSWNPEYFKLIPLSWDAALLRTSQTYLSAQETSSEALLFDNRVMVTASASIEE